MTDTSNVRSTVPEPALQSASGSAGGFSRRELLVAAAGLALAGCAEIGGRPTVQAVVAPHKVTGPLSVYADGTLPTALAAKTTPLLSGMPGIPGVREAQTLDVHPDVVLTFGAIPRGYSTFDVGQSPYVAITHLRVPIDEVTADQAAALLAGTVSDWSHVGAPYSLPVHMYALAGLPLPAGIHGGAAQIVATADDLLDQVRTQPGALALAPVEVADWTVRNLGIGGVYPAQGRGVSSPQPFAPLTLRLGAAPTVSWLGPQLAHALAPALAGATPTFDMVVAGDIILGRGVNQKMVAYHDYLYPYRKVRDEFLSADWRVANLECTISDLVPVPTDPTTFEFVTAKQAADGLSYAGIQTVTVANNHADNAGVYAFEDMLHTLQEHSITYCGGGSNLTQARQAVVQTVKGVRVALLGYDDIPPGGPFAQSASGGIAPIDLSTLAQDLAAARSQADLVIPYFHWGIEYTKVATRQQQQVAHAAIDAGADMVLGSHPHWAQSIESYRGRLIVYSLANFIFDQDWSRETLEGFMIHLYWRGTTLAGIRFVPTLIEDRCQPRIMSPSEAVGVFERMWSGTDLLAAGQYTTGGF
jgi:poly-gamma-glutamate capsule biosynthesis protein CapA/YwtB (metallophosphatase superfamily)